MDEWKEKDYLEHHGILGQKWGVRRFQNPDGSLTAAGRARYKGTNSLSQKFSEIAGGFSVELVLEDADPEEVRKYAIKMAERDRKRLENDRQELRSIQSLTSVVKKAMAKNSNGIIDNALNSVLRFLNAKQVKLSQQILVDERMLAGTNRHIRSTKG